MEKKLGTLPFSVNVFAKANIGLWAFEIDEGQPPRMYVDDVMLHLIGLEKQISPEETYHAWYDHVDAGHYDAVAESVKTMTEGNFSEVQYPWHHPDGHTMTVRCGGVRNFDYKKGVRIEGLHMDMADARHLEKAAMEKLREDARKQAIISSMAEDFELIVCVNMKTEEVITYRATDKFHNEIALVDESLPSNRRLDQFFKIAVHPDDLPYFMEMSDYNKVRAVIDRGEMYSFQCRTKDPVDGKVKYYRFKFARVPGENDLIIVGLLDVDEIIRTEQEAAAMAERIENQLVIESLADAYLSLYRVNINTGAYKILKRADTVPSSFLDENRSFFTFITEWINHEIFPADRELALEASSPDYIRRQFEKNRSYAVNIRHNRYENQYREMRFIRSADYETTGNFFVTFMRNHEYIMTQKKLQAQQLQLERNSEILSNMTDVYQSVYSVDTADDSFEIIKENKAVVQFYSDGSRFTEAFKGYIDNFVHSDDREMMRQIISPGYIASKLNDGDAFSTEFRDISEGATQWHEMNVTRISDSRVLFGFSNRTDEILLEHTSEKFFDDFLALYMINLDSDELRYATKYAGEGESGEGYHTFTEAMAAQVKNARIPETKEFLKSIDSSAKLRKLLKNDAKIEHLYQWRFDDDTVRWLKMTIFALENTGDEVSAAAVGISPVDELQAENLEQQEIIGAIAREFFAIYYMNLDTGTGRILRREMSDETAKLAEKYAHESLYKGLEAYINARVLPQYRDALLKLNTREGYLSALDGRVEYRLRFESEYTEGKTIWQELVLMKLCAEDEVPENIILGQRDITDLVAEEEENKKQLEAALAMANAASRSKTAFLNSMSHDIRTPLNAISGYTRMARKSLGDDEKVSEYLDKMEVSGQQLLSLINQVLEMARIESGKVVLTENPEDIVRSACALQTVCGADIERKKLSYSSNIINVSHSKVLTDGTRVSQILTNIIGNAIKYTPEGGSIDFTLEELPYFEKDYALYRFTIKDTGIGMSREYLEHLFEEFTREATSAVNGIQGTGLGMSIVKKLVDLMNGTIDIASAPGEGTCVTVTLPMKIDAEIPDAGVEKAAEDFDFTGKRVLLVEDNEMNREIARDILVDAGFTVETADDGDVAVEMVRRTVERGDAEYYDAVLMDIQMPRMDGYTATKAIKAIPDPQNTHLPVIALSANAFEEDRQKSIESGMDDHVAKPINIQELKEKLAKYI